MKHKIYLKSILTGLAMMAGFALVACTDDLVTEGKSAYSLFDESDIMEAQLGVSVNEFSISTNGATRADDDPDNEEPTDDTEIMSDFEKTVDNIWVFQYGEDGNLAIQPRYYTAKESEIEGTWHVLLKPEKSTIYVVTNVNDDKWVTSVSDFTTITQLLASTLPEPYTIYNLSDDATEGHIPMKGCTEEVTPGSNGEVIVVPVEHMYAKVKVRVIIDQLLEPYEPVINSVYAQNCPWYCQIGTLYDKTIKSQDDEYPTDANDWVTRSMMTQDKNGNEVGNNTDDPNNTPLKEADETPYDYVIYIPENIQGEVTVEEKDADAKADNLPDEGHPTSIVVELKYYTVSSTGTRDIENEAHYTVYPGGNNYNNFNIRRNQVYRVTMVLGAPETEHTPSANCIVGHPGKTISFEPYYRVETGGGYDFSDYLDPTDDSKTIKGLKILWQTLDCIGDNSNYDKVYIEPDVTDPVHSKIYVQVQSAGNAVIAAYANENCTGDILWSWHIWVTSEDPTNISNAITYYTYSWDKSGIKGYVDEDGNETGYARVPGYGMMSCNLGALSSTPSDAEDKSIFGMNYQWGRKDPFPPLIVRLEGQPTNSRAQPYSEETVGPIYDNSNTTKVGMTATARTQDNELFYSMPGTEVQNMTGVIAYTIKNPTVFMCGTYNAGTENQEGENEVESSSSYFNNGSWLPASEDTYNLWGGTNPEDASVSYTVDSSRGVHLYDDYGEKSIYDPCPYGWRVSPPDQWLGFTNTGKNPSTYADINTPGDNLGYGMYLYIQAWKSGLQSYFPTPGPRVGNGCGMRQFSCGNYHNATVDLQSRVNILHIHDNASNFHIFETSYYMYYVKSVAGPIRCVRDTK